MTFCSAKGAKLLIHATVKEKWDTRFQLCLTDIELAADDEWRLTGVFSKTSKTKPIAPSCVHVEFAVAGDANTLTYRIESNKFWYRGDDFHESYLHEVLREKKRVREEYGSFTVDEYSLDRRQITFGALRAEEELEEIEARVQYYSDESDDEFFNGDEEVQALKGSARFIADEEATLEKTFLDTVLRVQRREVSAFDGFRSLIETAKLDEAANHVFLGYLSPTSLSLDDDQLVRSVPRILPYFRLTEMKTWRRFFAADVLKLQDPEIACSRMQNLQRRLCRLVGLPFDCLHKHQNNVGEEKQDVEEGEQNEEGKYLTVKQVFKSLLDSGFHLNEASTIANLLFQGQGESRAMDVVDALPAAMTSVRCTYTYLMHLRNGTPMSVKHSLASILGDGILDQAWLESGRALFDDRVVDSLQKLFRSKGLETPFSSQSQATRMLSSLFTEEAERPSEKSLTATLASHLVRDSDPANLLATHHILSRHKKAGPDAQREFTDEEFLDALTNHFGDLERVSREELLEALSHLLPQLASPALKLLVVLFGGQKAIEVDVFAQQAVDTVNELLWQENTLRTTQVVDQQEKDMMRLQLESGPLAISSIESDGEGNLELYIVQEQTGEEFFENISVREILAVLGIPDANSLLEESSPYRRRLIESCVLVDGRIRLFSFTQKVYCSCAVGHINYVDDRRMNIEIYRKHDNCPFWCVKAQEISKRGQCRSYTGYFTREELEPFAFDDDETTLGKPLQEFLDKLNIVGHTLLAL